MNPALDPTEAGLCAYDGTPLTFLGVEALGQVNGLVFRCRMRQRYQNRSGHPLEVLYSFPLPWGAQLTALGMDIGDRHLHGQVHPKAEALSAYEGAIERGGLAVMVEHSALGLYTANVGNLLDGDTAIVEVEFTQTLTARDGRVRLTIPTVVSSRYGDGHRDGGLPEHEVVSTDPLAEHAWQLTLDIVGPIAKARLASPTHAVALEPKEEGVRITMQTSDVLDRDFALSADGVPAETMWTRVATQDACFAYLCLQPTLPELPARALRTKILVDCSGSMAGDSMAQARAALSELAHSLEERDRISFTRFGDSVEHVLDTLSSCSPYLVGHTLHRAISSTQAVMGGTQFHRALDATFRVDARAKEPMQADVLVITDGAVWEVEHLIDSAARSGHRVFAIGVGSAPAESLLRELAERSGGGCEFVTPGESMRDAVARLIARMRGAMNARLTIDWGGAPVWQSALPQQLVNGETVHVHAHLPQGLHPDTAPIVKLWVEGLPSLSIPVPTEPTRADGLRPIVRLGAAQRIRELDRQDPDQLKLACSLAMLHQLVTPWTHLLLVHEREDKAGHAGLPMVQHVPQMHAAGSHGLGTADPSVFGQNLRASSLWQAPPHRSVGESGVGEHESPLFSRRESFLVTGDTAPPGPGAAVDASWPFCAARTAAVTMADLIEIFNQLALSADALKEFIRQLPAESGLPKLLQLAKSEVAALLKQEHLTWAVLLQVIDAQPHQGPGLTRHARRALSFALAPADIATVAVAKQVAGLALSLE